MVRTLARSAMVFAAGGERSLVEGMHGVAIGGLEGQMYPRGVAIRFVDVQLVGIKVSGTFDQNVRQAERREHCAIEALAGLHVGHVKLNMVEQPAALEFHLLLLIV